jgi:hypothetical protein
MKENFFSAQSQTPAFNADELKEAERLFTWALAYEKKGLKIVADALREEGRKSLGLS